MAFERLDKMLSRGGFGTRKDVKKLCHRGSVVLNGKIETDPSAKIDISIDTVEIDGKPVKFQRDLYIMMNKCRDVVCANKDGVHRTVFDLIDDSFKHQFHGGTLHCVGRLDIDTEGLLLLTTDGELTHRLLSPKTHSPKTYAVGLRDALSDSEKNQYVEKFTQGFWIDREQNEIGFSCKSSELVFLDAIAPCSVTENSSGKADCLLTVYEGKYHQVKRMFSQIGNEVVYLKRIKMGGLELDSSLALGSYRELTAAEIDLLKNAAR